MLFYTIGHSNHTPEHFQALLRQYGVSAIADVRSQPYSRYAVEFNREVLVRWLADVQIAYVFLGDVLGGRPSDRRFYDDENHVLYEEMAKSAGFLGGIERLEEGAIEYQIAIMCGEENPAECHRNLLVSQVLLRRGHEVRHLRGDGSVESAVDLLAAKETGPEQMNMFAEEEPATWRSTRSVSRSGPPSSSSNR